MKRSEIRRTWNLSHRQVLSTRARGWSRCCCRLREEWFVYVETERREEGLRKRRRLRLVKSWSWSTIGWIRSSLMMLREGLAMFPFVTAFWGKMGCEGVWPRVGSCHLLTGRCQLHLGVILEPVLLVARQVQARCAWRRRVVASVDPFPGIYQKHLSTLHPPRANNTPSPSLIFNIPSQGRNISNTKRDFRPSSHYASFASIWISQLRVPSFNQDLNSR